MLLEGEREREGVGSYSAARKDTEEGRTRKSDGNKAKVLSLEQLLSAQLTR